MIAIIVLLIISVPLHAGAYASQELREIREDMFRLSLTDGNLFMDLGPMRVGQIDRSGLVRTIAEPHGVGRGIELECLPFTADGHRSGAVLALGPLSVGIALDDRPLAAASLSYDSFSLALLYAGDSMQGRPLMHQWRLEERETLYWAASVDLGFLRALGIASFSRYLGLDGFLSLSAEWNGYSVSIAAGGPPLLYDDYDRFLYSVSGMIKKDCFMSEFELRIGEAPVFSEDYLPYEAELRSILDIHGVIIYSAMEYSFSRRGRSRKRDRFTIRHGFLELGYDSDHGLVALFRYGGIEAGFDEGRGYVELERELDTEHSRLLLRLSSDRSVAVAIALDL